MPLGNPSYGIYCTPKASPGVTTASAFALDDAGFIEALYVGGQAGVDHDYGIQKWSELEPTVGDYHFGYVDRLVAHTGSRPLVLNIAVVDSDGQKHVPSSLSATAWDDASMTTAFGNLLTQLASHLDGRLVLLVVGNESDVYFLANPAQVTPFGTFLTAVKSDAQAAFDASILVSCCFAFSSIGSWASFSGVTSVCDIQVLTYYPINADFTVKAAGAIGDDFSSIATALGGAPFFLQEVGCPSSTALGSSEAYQADFVDDAVFVFDTYVNAGILRGATWLWLSDLSSAVLDSLSLAGNVRAYMGSIGLRTVGNVSKAAYGHLITALGGVDVTGQRGFQRGGRRRRYSRV